MQYPDQVRLIRVPCTGRVEVRHLLEALHNGADGVFVAGCLEGDCHYISGNLRARQRVEYAQKLLDEAGIGGERVRMYNLSAGAGPRFAEIVTEMVAHVSTLGPNPGKRGGAQPIDDAAPPAAEASSSPAVAPASEGPGEEESRT